MFDKLRKAFSSATKGLGQKEITEKVLDNTLLDLQIALLESDVAQDVVDSILAEAKKELLGIKLEKGEDAEEVIRSKLKRVVAEIFARAGRLDISEKIRVKKAAKAGPFSILFLGINGTGKTTTVAKVANMLRKGGVSVVVAAGDTHRAGAIEQLTQHCERLSIKVIAQRYGADPSAVGRDAVDYARKHYVDVVLVDTAGRMQTSKNLMDEMSKIVRVVKPDIKLFIGDSLAGNDTINQAKEFFQVTNFDGAILTKIDADAKGGSAISIAHTTSRPIVFVGIGQGYDDIIPFDPDKFIESLFGSASDVTVSSLMSEPISAEAAEPVEMQESVHKPIEEPEAEVATPEPPAKKEPPHIEPTISSPIAPKEHPRDSNPPTLPKRQSTQSFSQTSAPEPKTESVPSSPPVELRRTVDVIEQGEKAKPVEEEKPKAEKKGRFGFFGRKSKGGEDDRKKQDEEKDRLENEAKERQEKERQQREEEKEKQEKERKQTQEHEQAKKRKEDKDKGGEKDEVIYLSDEDIEDLLK